MILKLLVLVINSLLIIIFPFRVGDRVMVVNGKVGTIVSLHNEPCKYFRYYKYIPMIKIELDENKDLKYFASLTNIKKI